MTLKNRIAHWKKEPFDQDTIEAVEKLEKNSALCEDAFYKEVSFGTGGMRGIMGVGTNRINKYTLGKATQGLSNHLKKRFSNQIKVVIAYDCRHNSKEFASDVAQVLSANGITAYLFSELCPTPLLSYAVRHLGAQAGIVLTASHNPPEYNGYKVYNEFGGQIVPPQDQAIIDEIGSLDYDAILWKGENTPIQILDHEIDKAYLKEIAAKSISSIEAKKNTSIVFTALHGTSIRSIPSLLKDAGFEKVTSVEEQAKPNGDFPTVQSPNPEEEEAFEYALKKAKEIDADIIIGTDPDADRLGIGVKNLINEWTLLNGNQLMVVLTRFVLEQQPKEKLNKNSFIGTTVVSTPMMPLLASYFGVNCKMGITGFKWIGKMIHDSPKETFLCGGEESYGFLFGNEVRDKDAVSAALLACDLHAHLTSKGSTLYAYLVDTYKKLGCYSENQISITKKGKEGAAEIEQTIRELRQNPPVKIAGVNVLYSEDYNSLNRRHTSGKTEEINLPKTNMLRFVLEDKSEIAIRPSGTEPKIKYYFSVNDKLDNSIDFSSLTNKLEKKSQKLANAMIH